MKICSFDVGIKNLSYCVANFEKDNFEIFDWDNINLIDSDKNKTCCGIINKKGCEDKVCGKNAKYEVDDLAFCQTHVKKYTISPSILKFEEYLGSDRCVEKLKNNKICNKKARFLINNQTICLLCHRKLIKEETNKNTPQKIKNKKAKRLSPEYVCKQMINKFDSKPNLRDVDMLLIENQPGLKNPEMSSISCYLFQYFAIRGCIDDKRIKEVKYISASNKIKAKQEHIKLLKDKITEDCQIVKSVKKLIIKHHNLNLRSDITKIDNLLEKYDLIETSKNIIHLMIDSKVEVDQEIKDILTTTKIDPKKTPIYEITKNLGMLYAKLLNINNKKWTEHLKTFKKQDDLCDAFLQAYYYCDKMHNSKI
jgi:hypothetical protein